MIVHCYLPGVRKTVCGRAHHGRSQFFSKTEGHHVFVVLWWDEGSASITCDACKAFIAEAVLLTRAPRVRKTNSRRSR